MPASAASRSSPEGCDLQGGARLDYVQAQLKRTSTLARQSLEFQQAVDQAESDAASARADVTEAQANYDAAVAGPTQEERAIADAQVQAAAAAVAVLERRLEKMVLRAPADGVVSVIAAEVGENVRTGQPILMVEAAGKQWLSFNVREDRLSGLTVGEAIGVARNGATGPIKAVITELRPLGVFATWQAERVIGDHDRNTLRLRLDPQGEDRRPRTGHDRLDRQLAILSSLFVTFNIVLAQQNLARQSAATTTSIDTTPLVSPACAWQRAILRFAVPLDDPDRLASVENIGASCSLDTLVRMLHVVLSSGA